MTDPHVELVENIEKTVGEFSIVVRTVATSIGGSHRLTSVELNSFARSLIETAQKVLNLPAEFVVDVDRHNRATAELLARVLDIHVPDSPAELDN